MADNEVQTEKGTSKRDFAWAYAIVNPDEKYFRCKYCKQQCSGTINRFKHHLAGSHKGMKPCKGAPPDVIEKCKIALSEVEESKSQRNAVLTDIRQTAEGLPQTTSEPGVNASQPLVRGPMNDFVNSKARQSTLNSKWKKEERIKVCRKIGRFFFSAGLAFNASNDPYFAPMCEAIASYGPGFAPPTMHELRTWILKAEVDDIKKMMEEHKTSWKQYGCSIMSDSWTDGKSRCLINFLINSPAGTWFLKSVDASDTIKNGELLFNYLSTVIEEVGEENVVQIISDNGSNYVNAGKRLMERYKHLYWTPCAAHCIDLLLEDIGKLAIHQTTLAKAKQVVKFIYGHTMVLDLMRSFTKNQELLRPAVTRFATSFLTLQSIYKQKQALQSMFSSERWNSSSWARKPEGVKAKDTVMYDREFWGHVKYCILSVIPLVSVLREVDSEQRPAMGFIYELMAAAKERIAFNCNNNVQKYKPIWNKIDARWMPQLHRPLHAAGYYLNPQLRFGDKFSTSEEIKQGLYECMERMLDYRDRLKADVQLDQYHNAQGDFGTRIAIDSRKLRSPADWWMRFGSKTPELMKFAIRVLSLTCTSSGCERNWSTFEMIHTKKRNRLEHKKLNALAYVMYNTRLRERSIRRKLDTDPIVVEEVDSDDEWITEKEDPVLPNEASWLDDDNLFEVEVIIHILVTEYDIGSCSRPNISVGANIPSSQARKKMKTTQSSRSLILRRTGERSSTTRMTSDEDNVVDLEDDLGRTPNETPLCDVEVNNLVDGQEVGGNNGDDHLEDGFYSD